MEVFEQMMEDNENADEPYVLHDDYAEMFTLAGENNSDCLIIQPLFLARRLISTRSILLS